MLNEKTSEIMNENLNFVEILIWRTYGNRLWNWCKIGGIIMYTYFKPRMSVTQEEADIKEMIDKEYEQREQECDDYYK